MASPPQAASPLSLAPSSDYPHPPVRRLRVYAFDPQASTRIETVGFNHATITLPWDKRDRLRPGPVNEYLEVVDVDPVSGQFYDPVDLNHPHLLAQDGLAPSEGDPRFHQQMVFAVAMKTIKTFERALGRRIYWSPIWQTDGGPKKTGAYVPVKRLRIYPHAMREPNAYYSPDKKALLFGYFRASTREAGASWVFTCLSHDIVVHETTHAILDGLHRRYAEPTSVDSLAFHEAFADIVALLSHFTLREAVRDHIAAKGGQFSERSLMSGLAKQFGAATGLHGALREAIDDKKDDLPDPRALETMTEAHDRGAVLVAAVFDAFLTIYQQRTADLMRIGGVRIERGVGGELHPDLVERLSTEATKAADHVMRMCIRALDYLPPVDVRFGEFLRALITADTDLIPDDRLHYRLAVVEAFRRRGILPDGCLSLAPDSLLWEPPAPLKVKTADRKHQSALIAGDPKFFAKLNTQPRTSRDEGMVDAEKNRQAFWTWLKASDTRAIDRQWENELGVYFKPRESRSKPWKQTISHWPGTEDGEPRTRPKVEVHSVRTTRRAGPDGESLTQLVVEVTQRRRGFYVETDQAAQDTAASGVAPKEQDFIFRGGATLIFDLTSGALRYVIRKRIACDDDARLKAQAAYRKEQIFAGLAMTYRPDRRAQEREPFAIAHRWG